MSMAWETTDEDVVNAIHNVLGKSISYEKAGEYLEDLDHDKIEREALSGDDMIEQTTYAANEIVDQVLNLEREEIEGASKQELPLLVNEEWLIPSHKQLYLKRVEE